MPTYSIRDNTTGIITDMKLSLSEREQFLKDHPDHEVVILQAPGFAGSTPHLNKTTDSGWKETLARIHERTPGSKLDKISSVNF